MACARKCDICGKFYNAPEVNPYTVEPFGSNTSMVRLLQLKPVEDRGKGEPHYVYHFDACDECLGDVMEFILSRQATKAVKEESK